MQPPFQGAKLVRVNDEVARQIPGVVKIVHDGDFVGVIAERDEQALTAVRLLEAEWAPAEAPAMKPIDLILRRDDGVDAAFAKATVRLDAAITSRISRMPRLDRTPRWPMFEKMAPTSTSLPSGHSRCATPWPGYSSFRQIRFACIHK